MSEGERRPPPADIVLYRHVGCPYCERVVRRAGELGVEFASRFVVPEHRERGFVKHVSGGRTVPVLVDAPEGVIMAESADILAYLEANYGEAT